jgi:hypothetical protein
MYLHACASFNPSFVPSALFDCVLSGFVDSSRREMGVKQSRVVNAGFGGSPAVDETFGTPILSTTKILYHALQHRLSLFPLSGKHDSFPIPGRSDTSVCLPSRPPAPKAQWVRGKNGTWFLQSQPPVPYTTATSAHLPSRPSLHVPSASSMLCPNVTDVWRAVKLFNALMDSDPEKNAGLLAET